LLCAGIELAASEEDDEEDGEGEEMAAERVLFMHIRRALIDVTSSKSISTYFETFGRLARDYNGRESIVIVLRSAQEAVARMFKGMKG
jgi:hypothetical protein